MKRVQDAPVSAHIEGDLERLYREEGDRLWRALYAFAGDREVASDAMAEAFAQALRGGDSIRAPLPWVWKASFRIAAGELKARGRWRELVAAQETAAPQADSSAAELVAALARISPKQRAAVVLHHYAGYPVKEVAEIIGSTGPAVRVHLSRGRKRLRELLRDEDA
jgi:RNA polymerase sigma factor (sigma-70 family)